MHRLRMAVSVLVAAGLIMGGAVGASAKQLPKSKLHIKLDAQRFDSGADVTGSALLYAVVHKVKTGLPNETLDLQVDGVDVGTTITDADGNATIDIPGVADGQHILGVIFAGDSSYRGTQKQHGFCVGTNCNKS